jgi:hypothetical protein
MDFSNSEVIKSSPVKGSPVSNKDGLRKVQTVKIQLLLIMLPDGTSHPIGVAVANNYPIKTLLEYKKTFPCNSDFPAHVRVLYPDTVKAEISTYQFSMKARQQFSTEQLTHTSWMPNSVISLVTDTIPENVMDAYDLIKTLDTKVVLNPLGDAAKIKIEILPHFEIPDAEVFALKTIVVDIVNSRTIVTTERKRSAEEKTYVILGAKEQKVATENETSKKLQLDDIDEEHTSSSSAASSSSAVVSSSVPSTKKAGKK